MSASPTTDPITPTPGTAQLKEPNRGWTPARIIALVAGGILGLASLGALSAGGWATWMTNTQRDAAGYVTTNSHTVATTGAAITSVEVGELPDRVWSGIIGTIRLRATATDPSTGIFIGVAPTAAVNHYLAGVGRTTVTGWFPVATHEITPTGATPNPAPINSRIWTEHVAGPGTQALTWSATSGTTVVVMHPDGTPGVSAAIDVGATVPDLAWLAVLCFVVGVLMLGAGTALVVVPVRRSQH